MITGGRRGGKSLAQRRAIETATRAGEHVHHASPAGVWCVTMTGIGLLWVKIG